MWLSGVSKNILYKLFELLFKYSPLISSGVVYPEKFFIVSFLSKFPLITVIYFLLSFASSLLLKLNFSKKFLLIFALLLSLEPFYLGITGFYHLSGLESAFIFSSSVSLIYFLKKYNLKYLIISSILFALAFATKSPALVVTPVFVILVFLFLHKKPVFIFKVLLIYIFIFLCTLYLIFPASWLEPFNIFIKIYQKGVLDRGFSDNPHASILNNRFLYYYEIFFTKTLGLNIVFLFLVIWGIYSNKINKHKYLFIYSGMFSIYYFLIMSFLTKQLTRYTVIAYPFIFMIIAYGYYFFLSKNIRFKKVFLVFVFIYYSLTFYSLYPNFSTFHGEFLGGYRGYFKYKRIINDGEHYLQAGQYLNNKYKNEAYNFTLVTTEGNKVVSVKNVFLGETFTGKVRNVFKKYSTIYVLSSFDDTEDKPDCPIEERFGHRWGPITLLI